MPSPNPGIEDLLRSPQFRGPTAPPPAARPPAAASAPPVAAFGRQAAPQAAASPAGAPPPGLGALLASILAPPVAAPAPQQPTRSPEVEELISEALAADPEAERKPLFLAAERLTELGLTADDLGLSIAHLGLTAAPNWDAQGGFLIARSPEILEQAEQLKERGEPVPIVSTSAAPPAAKGTKRRGFGRRRAVGPAQAQAKPDGTAVPSATAVKPLSPAFEESRRERARQHLSEARSARNYENYGSGRLEWRRSGQAAEPS